MPIKRIFSRAVFCAALIALSLLVSSVAVSNDNAHSTSFSSLIEPPVFDRALIQGNLITGKLRPGLGLKLSDQVVKTAPEGTFVFGLGRDYPKKLSLTVFSENDKRTFHYFVLQRKYDTQSIKGVDKKYVSPPKETYERISKDAREVKQARNKFSQLRYFLQEPILPSKGRITGVYGSQRIFNDVPKRPHYGLDIAAAVGTAVVAPMGGQVVLAHPDMYYSGGTLIIDHGRGVTSTFIHLSKIDVPVGQQVEQGEKIGEIGATGRVTGPHLDWRLNWFGERLDPALLFKQRPVRSN